MRYFSFFIFLLFFVLTSEAQDKDELNERFDSVFYDVAVKLSPVNVKRAEKVADSLLKASKQDIHKVKALMLLADVLEKQAKRERAIKHALKAEKLASSNQNYIWLARIHGFLATQYRMLGLIEIGEKHLDKGIESAKRIQDENSSKICLGMLLQERAHYAVKSKKYNESTKLLKQATIFFKDAQCKNKPLFLGINSVLIGENFVSLKENDSAWSYYDKSLKYLNSLGVKKSQWIGEAFHGKGQILLEKKEYEQASFFLIQSLKIADSLNHKVLLETVYKDLSKLYNELGDEKKYKIYHEKYLKVVIDTKEKEKETVNEEVNRILNKQQIKFSNLSKVTVWFSVLIMILMVFAYMIKRKANNDNKKFVEVLSKLKYDTKQLSEAAVDSKNGEKESFVVSRVNSEMVIPKETENNILKKLKEFEEENGFIDSSITLPKLSSELGINTKYLSYIINKHKKRDFNNYINRLRVFYIANKIKDNPVYLNYKISYLSSECGFSSHSRFSAIFKKEIGLTPSIFINQVRKAENKK